MLLYPRSCSAMGLLMTCAGSALPRAFVPALLSSLWCIILELTGLHYQLVGGNHGSGSSSDDNSNAAENFADEFRIQNLFQNNHTYAYQAFAYMVGIALVFRTNVAYSRYWEGITAYKTFAAKWGDSCSFVMSFDRHGSNATAEDNEATRSLFAALCAHRFSLLHALACAHLRRENFLRPVINAPTSPSGGYMIPGPPSLLRLEATPTPIP